MSIVLLADDDVTLTTILHRDAADAAEVSALLTAALADSY